MRLLKGEKITDCIAGDAVSHLACVLCRIPAIRTIVIAQSELGANDCALHRTVSLCQDHFVEACILFPELQEVERRSRLQTCV